MIEAVLKKDFGNFSIDVNMQFESLRNVLFGVSGSGKSSILKMIAGFYEPDYGKIVVNSRVLLDTEKGVNVSIYKRNVGYIPQEYTLFPHMDIEANLLYGVKAKGLKFDKDKFDFLVELTGLKNLLKAYPHQVSGGQRQRVSLVRALLVEPDILLLDEPFSALDRPIRDGLKELLVELLESFKVSAIFVTHDLEEAYEFSEEIAILENGRIVQIGKKGEVFSEPKSRSIAKLLGFKNIFEIDELRSDEIVIKDFSFKVEHLKNNCRFAFIRPEDVLLLRMDRDISDKENVLFGRVLRVFEKPSGVLLKIKSKELVVYSKVTRHVVDKMGISEGMRVAVSLKRDAIVCGDGR